MLFLKDKFNCFCGLGLGIGSDKFFLKNLLVNLQCEERKAFRHGRLKTKFRTLFFRQGRAVGKIYCNEPGQQFLTPIDTQ